MATSQHFITPPARAEGGCPTETFVQSPVWRSSLVPSRRSQLQGCPFHFLRVRPGLVGTYSRE